MRSVSMHIMQQKRAQQHERMRGVRTCGEVRVGGEEEPCECKRLALQLQLARCHGGLDNEGNRSASKQ